MNELPEALRGLNDYPNFIVWEAVTDGATGDVKKVPIDHANGLPGLAHESLDFSGARAHAQRLNMRVGYRLTTNDPFFLVDIDKCRPEGQWSPLAEEWLSWFPGAAVEISQSGRGLHILGSYGNGPDTHSCKRADLGTEYYTQDRFIALTGDMLHAEGCVLNTHDAALNHLATNVFLPRKNVLQRNWTERPCDEWGGPTENDDLLAAMFAAAKPLGNRASAQQLWERDVDALAVAYPSQTGAGDYDSSSAEMALCNVFAFWTGKDCARIESLMDQSKLASAKWREREVYRRDTILNAVSSCTSVYSKVKNDTSDTAEITDIEGTRLLHAEEQKKLFEGVVYVVEDGAAYTPIGDKLKESRFNVVYGGYSFMMEPSGKSKPEKRAWEVLQSSQLIRIPRIDATCFMPQVPPRSLVKGPHGTQYNIYRPLGAKGVPGDVSRFTELLTHWLPDERDRDILLTYCSSLILNPGVKFSWAPVIQSVPGAGKQFLIMVMEHAIGWAHCSKPSAKSVNSQFNLYVKNKILVVIDELQSGESKRRGLTEFIKELIGNVSVMIEGKGVDQYMSPSCCNFLLFTNHQDAIEKTEDERRLSPLYLALQTKADLVRCGIDGDFFMNLFNWGRAGGFDNITHYLRNYPINPEFDPCHGAQTAPVTSTTHSAIAAAIDHGASLLLEAVNSNTVGFRGGWVSSIMAFEYLKDANMHVQFGHPKKVAASLASIGYVHHPALFEGRSTRGVESPDRGRRPKLYIKKDSELAQLSSSEVVPAYSAAQSMSEK